MLFSNFKKSSYFIGWGLRLVVGWLFLSTSINSTTLNRVKSIPKMKRCATRNIRHSLPEIWSGMKRCATRNTRHSLPEIWSGYGLENRTSNPQQNCQKWQVRFRARVSKHFVKSQRVNILGIMGHNSTCRNYSTLNILTISSVPALCLPCKRHSILSSSFNRYLI